MAITLDVVFRGAPSGQAEFVPFRWEPKPLLYFEATVDRKSDTDKEPMPRPEKPEEAATDEERKLAITLAVYFRKPPQASCLKWEPKKNLRMTDLEKNRKHSWETHLLPIRQHLP